MEAKGNDSENYCVMVCGAIYPLNKKGEKNE